MINTFNYIFMGIKMVDLPFLKWNGRWYLDFNIFKLYSSDRRFISNYKLIHYITGLEEIDVRHVYEDNGKVIDGWFKMVWDNGMYWFKLT